MIIPSVDSQAFLSSAFSFLRISFSAKIFSIAFFRNIVLEADELARCIYKFSIIM